MPFLWAQSPPAPTSALWCTDGGIVLIQNLLSSLAVRLTQNKHSGKQTSTAAQSRSHSAVRHTDPSPVHPSIRLCPPPVYFNPVPDRKPAHSQVHQSICQVRQSINNWPFRGSILSPPHLSSWHTKQTKSGGGTIFKKEGLVLLASKPRLIFRLSCECGVKYYTDAILLGGAAVNRCDLPLLFAWITEDNDAYF